MTARVSKRPPKLHLAKTLSKGGLDAIDLMTTSVVNPRQAFEADVADHQRRRQCIARGCEETVPCPHHGEPAGDNAVNLYFWPKAARQ